MSDDHGGFGRGEYCQGLKYCILDILPPPQALISAGLELPQSILQARNYLRKVAKPPPPIPPFVNTILKKAAFWIWVLMVGQSAQSF